MARRSEVLLCLVLVLLACGTGRPSPLSERCTLSYILCEGRPGPLHPRLPVAESCTSNWPCYNSKGMPIADMRPLPLADTIPFPHQEQDDLADQNNTETLASVAVMALAPGSDVEQVMEGYLSLLLGNKRCLNFTDSPHRTWFAHISHNSSTTHSIITLWRGRVQPIRFSTAIVSNMLSPSPTSTLITASSPKWGWAISESRLLISDAMSYVSGFSSSSRKATLLNNCLTPRTLQSPKTLLKCTESRVALGIFLDPSRREIRLCADLTTPFAVFKMVPLESEASSTTEYSLRVALIPGVCTTISSVNPGMFLLIVSIPGLAAHHPQWLKGTRTIRAADPMIEMVQGIAEALSFPTGGGSNSPSNGSSSSPLRKALRAPVMLLAVG